MMVKILLYAYCIGVPSSGKIARKLEEDFAFRVLAANNIPPDFRTPSGLRACRGTKNPLPEFTGRGFDLKGE
jgi:transposase